MSRDSGPRVDAMALGLAFDRQAWTDGTATGEAVGPHDPVDRRNAAVYYGIFAEMAALQRRVDEASGWDAPSWRWRIVMVDLARWAWRGLRCLLPPRRLAATCRASGWGMHPSCTDGRGRAICPVCSRGVGTRPGVAAGRLVRVIEAHLVGRGSGSAFGGGS